MSKTIDKTVTFKIPEILDQFKFNDFEYESLINKFRSNYIAEASELYAMKLCKREFDIEFTKPTSRGNAGFDIISIDEKIKVEVKQTSSPWNGKNNPTIGISSLGSKKGKCDWIIVMDFFSVTSPRVSLIPEDVMFSGYAVRQGSKDNNAFLWDSTYKGKVRPDQTEVFLKYEIES